MKITNLDGTTQKISINLNDYKVKSSIACRSKLEYICGEYLKKKYPYSCILQDFTIPNTRMSLDFWVIGEIAVEIDGIQHYKPIDFYGGIQGFDSQKDRDALKTKWCAINNIRLVRVTKESDLSLI